MYNSKNRPAYKDLLHSSCNSLVKTDIDANHVTEQCSTNKQFMPLQSNTNSNPTKLQFHTHNHLERHQAAMSQLQEFCSVDNVAETFNNLSLIHELPFSGVINIHNSDSDDVNEKYTDEDVCYECGEYGDNCECDEYDEDDAYDECGEDCIPNCVCYAMKYMDDDACDYNDDGEDDSSDDYMDNHIAYHGYSQNVYDTECNCDIDSDQEGCGYHDSMFDYINYNYWGKDWHRYGDDAHHDRSGSINSNI